MTRRQKIPKFAKCFPLAFFIAPCLIAFAAGPAGKPAVPATQPATEPARPIIQSVIFDDLNRFHRIAFATDASGSMMQKMATLKDQINKAVVSLSTDQFFCEIFFQNTGWSQFSDRLLPATDANKRKAGEYLEGVPITRLTDPIPGIEAAFMLHPEVIYLVTDGDFPDNDAVLKKIRELNKDKKVKVYTIAFVGGGDSDTAFIDLLKTVATENGGTYKHVNEGDI